MFYMGLFVAISETNYAGCKVKRIRFYMGHMWPYQGLNKQSVRSNLKQSVRSNILDFSWGHIWQYYRLFMQFVRSKM